MAVGVSPSSSHANTSAETTSARPTNDANRDPSRRLAPMPSTYAIAAVTTPSAMIGTHHGTVASTNDTSTRGASKGTSPTAPAPSRSPPPNSRPPVASAIGGKPLSSSAEITQYTAAPAIAPSAHSTPTRSTSAPETRSSTSTSPAAAITAPVNVHLPGR